MMKLKILLIFTAIFFSCLTAQSKKNIEVIFNMVDESLEEIKNSDNQSYVLKFNSVDNLDIVKGRVVYNLNDSEQNTNKELSYTVDTLKVEYPELYRDGLFGDYYLVRQIKLSGYYSVIENSKIISNNTFNYSSIDTVQFVELTEIETQAIDFTKGEVPDEPFLDSLVETLIAVGSAVVSIILFFTIRSD